MLSRCMCSHYVSKKNVRGQAEKNAKSFPIEIYSVFFVAFYISQYLDLSARSGVEQAYLGSNVRALVLPTFIKM